MSLDERRSAFPGDRVSEHDSGMETPAALCASGFLHMQAGRSIEAQVYGQKALAADPDHAEAQHLMGLLSLEAGQADHAIEWFVRAIGQIPKVEYIHSLGTALQRLGRLEEARMAFDKAVQLKPDDAELWAKLGGALKELGRPADALLTFQHVLKLSPSCWDAAYESALIFHQEERFEEAIGYFDLRRELRPSHALTLQMRGLSLAGL